MYSIRSKNMPDLEKSAEFWAYLDGLLLKTKSIPITVWIIDPIKYIVKYEYTRWSYTQCSAGSVDTIEGSHLRLPQVQERLYSHSSHQLPQFYIKPMLQTTAVKAHLYDYDAGETRAGQVQHEHQVLTSTAVFH